jgi:hypothetical protein
MKIRKNGKVINLTESDVKRIVKRTLNEAVTGANNINVYPEKAVFGYDHGDGMRKNKDITVNPGDTLRIAVFIPSDAPPKTPVSILNPSVDAGTVSHVSKHTVDGKTSSMKNYGIDSPSVVRAMVSFDDLKKLKALIGSNLVLKLGGSNFNGGDASVKVPIPSGMNVVTGSAKS